jgi:hypothetical protein
MRLFLRWYKSTRRRHVLSDSHLELKLCGNSICSLSSKNYCFISYVQDFPHKAIKLVCTKMWSSNHGLRKHIMLQVHRNSYKIDGHKAITLEAMRSAWMPGPLSTAYQGLIFWGLRNILLVECPLYIMAIGVSRRGGLLHSRLLHPCSPWLKDQWFSCHTNIVCW